MNPTEQKAYEELMNVPHKKKIAAAAKKTMRRVAEDRFKAQTAVWAERKARLKPVHQAMRLATKKSPELAGIRAAIEALSKKKRPAHKRPKLVRLPAPKSPYLKLGSAHVVVGPPYSFANQWLGVNGSARANIEPNADDSNGNMSFDLVAGLDGANNGGSGNISCWAAVGELLTTSNEGMLTFTANRSFNWSAWWVSNYWREAAGSLWIGEVIERFDSNGVYIDTPVVTQNILESFDDYNLSDMGNKSGLDSGSSMAVNLFLESDLIYNCWVWMGCSTTADFSDGQSLTELSMNANVSSLAFDLI
jgi:hypothetical protein